MYNTRKSETRQISALDTRAAIVPSSVNEEERTIEVVFGTETPVKRTTWDDGPWLEVLSFNPDHIRVERLANGVVPVLDNHRSWSGADGVLGSVSAYRIEGGKGYATLRFAKTPDVDNIWRKVADGHIKGVSVGYRIHKMERDVTADPNNPPKIPTYRAIDWEPMEISIAPIPADENSGVRSEAPNNSVILINHNNEETMKREEIIALLQKRGISVDSAATDAELLAQLERAMTPAPAPAPAPAAPAAAAEGGAGEDATRTATAAERARVAEINTICRQANMSDEDTQKFITEGTSVDDVRKAALAKFISEDPNKGTRGGSPITGAGGHVGEAGVRDAMVDALMLRADPMAKVKNPEAVREFRGMTLLRMAEESLTRQGVNIKGWNPREIAQAALGLGVSERGYHSSSDFPIVLGNTINRTLRAAYELQERTFMPFCRRVSFSDFREHTQAQISGLMGTFDKIAEGGEYKATTMTEGKESYRLEKYGRKIAITWESLINDDLNAFSRIPSAFAARAAEKQSDLVYGILTGNPTMGDGTALFHSTHGNLAGSGGAISVATLSAARAAMRKQKGLEGSFINVTARFLVVGPDKETEAQQIINAAIVANKDVDTNVFKNSLQIIVDPRLTGNQWYLAAAPTSIDTIEYAFLDGEGELFTEQRTGFDIDGFEIKARMVFATKAIDWRGLYKNAGA